MARNLRSNVLEGGLTVDPSAGAGVPAAIGSILPRRGTTELWQKIGAADTAWQLFSSNTVFSSQGWYGSGIDGAHVVAGTETLTRVMEWTTLVVPNGTILNTDGWYFLCTVSVDVQAGGVIRCNGNPSVGSAGGGGGGAATRPYQVGGTGGSGQAGAGSPSGTLVDQPKPLATTGAGSSRGGAGGSGNGGVNAGGAAGSVTLTAIRWSPLQLPWCLFGSFPQNALTLFGISNGGGGGGGAGGLTGMGGGGGGGGLGFAAPSVTNNGAIQAIGGTSGNAVNANTGGGGGGGGGKVFIACRVFTGTQPDVSGGGGGAGNGTGAAGSPGNTGYVQLMTGV